MKSDLQPSDIQEAVRYVNAVEYERAYNCLYYDKRYDIVESYMKNNGCGFWRACQEKQNDIDRDLDKIEAAKCDARVSAFKEQYARFDSGHSKGELVRIEYIARDVTDIDTVRDTRKIYASSRKSKLYNSCLQHGYAILEVDLRHGRVVFRERVKTKNKKEKVIEY